jgi:hypothetical protein
MLRIRGVMKLEMAQRLKLVRKNRINRMTRLKQDSILNPQLLFDL